MNAVRRDNRNLAMKDIATLRNSFYVLRISRIFAQNTSQAIDRCVNALVVVKKFAVSPEGTP